MESLLVFAKAPVAGQVKTRLAAERGDKEAAILYTAFLEDIAEICRQWQQQTVAVDPNRRLIFMVDPGPEDPVLTELARRAGARLVTQAEGDLGQRLEAAFATEFERGARAVCAIGTDSPTLPAHLIDHAFRALMFERAVLGPTFDGGYWLVGAQRPPPELFHDIPWSTAAVLNRTLSKLRAQGVSGYLLPFWYDIDEAADMERLVWHVRALRETDKSIAANTYKALTRIGLIRGEVP